MKTNFYPLMFRDPLSIAAAVGGLIQGGIGAVQQGKNNRNLRRLFRQREAFQTPEEIFDIVNMTANNAQTGLGAETTNYLTGQADRGLTASLDAATRLGADPNQIGGVLDSYFQDIFSIGNENELAKMRKFDSLMSATQLLAQNKEAEWASQQEILKDQMAMYGQRAQAGAQNLNNGLNLALSGAASALTPTYPLTNPQTAITGRRPTPLSNTQGGQLTPAQILANRPITTPSTF